MIEVFKTNVHQLVVADRLVEDLLSVFPSNRINFDLQDCDNILRVEGENVSTDQVIAVVIASGYQAEVL